LVCHFYRHHFRIKWLPSLFAVVILFNQYGLLAQHDSVANNAKKKYAGVDVNTFDTLIVSVTDVAAFQNEAMHRKLTVIPIRQWPRFNVVSVHNYKGLTDALSTLQTVLFIDGKRKAHAETLVSWQDLTVNAFNAIASRGAPNLVLSVKEKTIDTADIDFRGRFVQSTLQDLTISQHANEMATIAAGGGNVSPFTKGLAWQSLVTSSSFENLLPDDDGVLNALNVSVQNHSYGTFIQNFYGAEARAYDQSVLSNPTRLHVFSIGNAGQLSGTGIYANLVGFATATGNFKMAKNVWVVGTHKKDFTVDARNSRGPAFDGRVLPHMVAYGEDGTSDGAAIIAGLALVVQDEFKQKFNRLPHVATITSIMVAAADDIAAPAVDFVTGFGAANGKKTIEIIRNENIWEASVPNNDSVDRPLTIPPNTHQLRLALSWLDPAAVVGSTQTLLHDLDIELISPDGQTIWLPWVLSTVPHVDSLQKNARRKVDHLNTVELISLTVPNAGLYTIRVRASSLTQPFQNFSVAYRLDLKNDFAWTFPFLKESAETNTERYLRWSTTFAGNALLQYRYQDSDWMMVNTAIDLQKQYHLLTLPERAGTIKYKMLIDGLEFESDWLTLTPRLAITVGFNCPNQVMLNWPTVPGATGYTIMALGANTLQELVTVADTVFIFNKNQINVKHFAVVPIMAGGPGLRSLTYRYDFVGSGCYFKFLSALPEGDDVHLSLQLSTTYNVARVSFQRGGAQVFSDVGIGQQPLALTVQALDVDAPTGVLQYRAQIELLDQSIITTDTVLIYVANEKTYSVFPNPVYRGETLTILTDGNELEIEFFNSHGGKVGASPVTGVVFRPTINIDFPPGVYLYRLLRHGMVKRYGRLLVR
jgi:hypothetical protein